MAIADDLAAAVTTHDDERVQHLLTTATAEDVQVAVRKLTIPTLCQAAVAGHVPAVRLFLRNPRSEWEREIALRTAAAHGHLTTVQLLLQVMGALANKNVALHRAAMHGHVEVVQYFLSSFEDLDVNEALYWATFLGYPETVCLLMNDARANPRRAAGIFRLALTTEEIDERIREHHTVHSREYLFQRNKGILKCLRLLVLEKGICDFDLPKETKRRQCLWELVEQDREMKEEDKETIKKILLPHGTC